MQLQYQIIDRYILIISVGNLILAGIMHISLLFLYKIPNENIKINDYVCLFF